MTKKRNVILNLFQDQFQDRPAVYIFEATTLQAVKPSLIYVLLVFRSKTEMISAVKSIMEAR